MKRTMIALLLGAFGLVGCSTYSGTPATTPSAPITAPGELLWDATPFDCAALAGEADKPATLPDGVGRITLCNEPGHEIGQVTPTDALIIDPGAVVAAYNAQERANLAVMTCTAELGPAYRLVLEYPEGRVVQLRGELYGCRVVGDRTGAPHVLDAFVMGLLEQRKAAPVTLDDPIGEPVCEAMGMNPLSWLPATMDTTVAGYLCADGAKEARTIDATAWETIRDDWAAHATEGGRTEQEMSSCTQTYATTLVGATASGERVVLQGMCGVWEHWRPGTDTSWVWRPGPAASAIIEAAG